MRQGTSGQVAVEEPRERRGLVKNQRKRKTTASQTVPETRKP